MLRFHSTESVKSLPDLLSLAIEPEVIVALSERVSSECWRELWENDKELVSLMQGEDNQKVLFKMRPVEDDFQKN